MFGSSCPERRRVTFQSSLRCVVAPREYFAADARVTTQSEALVAYTWRGALLACECGARAAPPLAQRGHRRREARIWPSRILLRARAPRLDRTLVSAIVRERKCPGARARAWRRGRAGIGEPPEPAHSRGEGRAGDGLGVFSWRRRGVRRGHRRPLGSPELDQPGVRPDVGARGPDVGDLPLSGGRCPPRGRVRRPGSGRELCLGVEIGAGGASTSAPSAPAFGRHSG